MPYSYFWVAGCCGSRIHCHRISCDSVPTVLWVGLGTAFFTFTNALAHNGRFVDFSVPDGTSKLSVETGEVIPEVGSHIFLHSSFYPVCWAD